MAKVNRSTRLYRRQQDALETKALNVRRKIAERRRRDARMIAKINKGSLPFTPDVMSWLSRHLQKPTHRITAEDLKSLTA